MEIQLKRLRKEAGYRNRKDFAAALGDGFTERRITSWENGERMLSLEQACVLADFLHCSLDELAGRRFSSPASPPADPAAADLVDAYGRCTPERRAALVQSARDAALASGEAPQRGDVRDAGVA